MRLSNVQFLRSAAVAALVCYEGEPDPNAAPANQNPAQVQTPAGKAFTQEDVNKFLAEDRRKHAAKLSELETKLNSTMQTTQMTQQQRDELAASLEDVQKQLMTKEQVALQEKARIEKELGSKLKSESERASALEKKYTDATIRRAITDAAAANEAFSVEQIVALLHGKTKLVDDQPVVGFNDIHAETGQPIVTQLSPTDAVKRMREMPEAYGNLFKSNVVIGVGATNGQAQGKIDVRKLTPQQYAKLRKENPAALGF